MKRHETVKTKVLGFSFYNECLLSCAGSGVDRSQVHASNGFLNLALGGYDSKL